MANADDLYPWLSEPWRTLDSHFDTGRLPQALLVHGPAGVGKRRLAQLFAHKLLCAGPGEFACGHCPGCRLFAAGTHPDYITVEPAEPGKAIGVDRVRQLIADLALKSQYGGYRVVVFHPAQAMNLSAANALLKTLEEPAERTLMLLLAESLSTLPATILSRCQKLAVPLPDSAAACGWLAAQSVAGAPEILLAAARGAPLGALALAGSNVVERRRAVYAEWAGLALGREDPLAVAERWESQPHGEFIDWLSAWTLDLIRLKSAPGLEPRYAPDLAEELRTLAGGLDLMTLFNLWSLLLKAKAALGGQANRRLLLEELLIHWAQPGRFKTPTW
jgi:DNA polymerase-3 subunit delta'